MQPAPHLAFNAGFLGHPIHIMDSNCGTCWEWEIWGDDRNGLSSVLRTITFIVQAHCCITFVHLCSVKSQDIFLGKSVGKVNPLRTCLECNCLMWEILIPLHKVIAGPDLHLHGKTLALACWVSTPLRTPCRVGNNRFWPVCICVSGGTFFCHRVPVLLVYVVCLEWQLYIDKMCANLSGLECE